MNKKLVTGVLIAIAAGLATYFYRRRNRLSAIAADTYDTMDDTLRSVEDKTENFF